MPAARLQSLIVKVSPLLAVTASGYVYYQHDKRDIDAYELRKAHRSLECLDVRPLHQSTSLSSTAKKSILQRHLANLESSGATMIRSVLTLDAAAQWDSDVSRQIAKNDGTCIVPAGGAIGRIHCQIVKRNRPQRGKTQGGDLNRLYNGLVQVSATPNNEEIGIKLNDLAREYFASYGISDGQFELAQLQLLDAAPRSTNQIWHRDNAKPGLTALIALHDVGVNGPTEMILRSHNCSPMDVLTLTRSKQDVPRILLAAIKSGDAICYDSRILHRGRGYGNDANLSETFDHRPVLVIRWDATHTPAPGTRMIGTQLNKWEGKCLALGCTVRGWLS